MGMVTPLGCGVEATWRGWSPAKRRRKVDTFEVSDLPARIACMIPRATGAPGTFNPNQWMEPKEQRKATTSSIYAMCAARQAIEDAGCAPKTYEEEIVIGVMIGSGIGGIGGIAETALVLKERGRAECRRFHPGASHQRSPPAMCRSPTAQRAQSRRGHRLLHRGTCDRRRARLIALGDAEVMVAGGTESPLDRLSMAGFAACPRAVDRLQRRADAGVGPTCRSDQLGIDLGAAALACSKPQHHHAGALAHHEAVAIAVEAATPASARR